MELKYKILKVGLLLTEGFPRPLCKGMIQLVVNREGFATKKLSLCSDAQAKAFHFASFVFAGRNMLHWFLAVVKSCCCCWDANLRPSWQCLLSFRV